MAQANLNSTANLFTELKQPGYLDYDIPKTLRNKLTKIRISAHSLAIETGRYTKAVTPSDQRTCKYENINTYKIIKIN